MEWKAIKGWEGWYEVSENGDVRTVERIVTWDKPTPKANYRRVPSRQRALTMNNNTGYWQVNLSRDNKCYSLPVHVAVCQAFHGVRPSPHHQVAHNDGSRANNHYTNLRWATPKENQNDRRSHGTHVQGVDHHQAKLTDDDVRRMRALFSQGIKKAEIARLFKVHFMTASDVIRGKLWKHVE